MLKYPIYTIPSITGTFASPEKQSLNSKLAKAFHPSRSNALTADTDKTKISATLIGK